MSRPIVLNKGKFQYGNYLHLFTGTSICDNYDYSEDQLKNVIKNYDFEVPSKDIPIWTHLYYFYKISGSIFDKVYENIYKEFHLKPYRTQALLFSWAIKPTYLTREFVNQIKLKTFGTVDMPRCVAMHVRHGDKFKESILLPFEHYHQTMLNLNLKDINIVYLLTDDNDVITKAKLINENKNTNQIKYIFSDVERYSSDKKALTSFNKNRDRDLYGLEINAELEIASQCEYFIGTTSSNIGIIIYQKAIFKSTFNNWKEFTLINLD